MNGLTSADLSLQAAKESAARLYMSKRRRKANGILSVISRPIVMAISPVK
ncbi:MAG: hypothetical protein WCE81_05640 [Halobacteriota archaeon]